MIASLGPNLFDNRFYVFSVERGGGACWWKPHHRGYTSHLSEAGKYTLAEVNAILAESRGEDIPVPVELVHIIAAIQRGLQQHDVRL